MKTQLTEIQKLQKIAGILKENQELNLQESTLLDLTTKLYTKAMENREVDPDNIEDIINRLAKKAGPVKKSPDGAITLKSLNDKQLAEVIKFLKAVNKRGYLDWSDSWNGVKITSEDDDYDDDY